MKEISSKEVPVFRYINLINWFWDEVPYMDGFKASHATLFLALVDAINKNFWRPNTQIAYDRIINKCKFSKQVYLDGREWLITNGLIEMIPGRNAYQMAVFNLGIAVRNQTANTTSTMTGTTTTGQTATWPVTLPIINTTKPKKIKKEKEVSAQALFEINISFEIFWTLYDKKVGEKGKLEKKWIALTDEERQKAIDHIPFYKQSEPDKKFRKNPETYLNNKSFNDEIITSSGGSNIKNSFSRSDSVQSGQDTTAAILRQSLFGMHKNGKLVVGQHVDYDSLL